MTIDTDVEARTPDGRLVLLARMAIVETKSAGPPSDADRALWSLGHRPTRVSKFGTSLAALRPELPSNTWTRALGRPWLVSDAQARVGAEPEPRPLAVRPKPALTTRCTRTTLVVGRSAPG